MKNLARRSGALALALAIAVATACSSDRSAAPTSPAIDATRARADGLIGDAFQAVGSTLGSLRLVSGLQRTTPLPNDITVSATIDGAGGTLSIPEAGVTVTVPRGALVGPTTIVMTARAGRMVAYDFEPHGITFARPLVFTQKLQGTNATLLTMPFLKLGYYPDERMLGSTMALVTELISGSVNLLNRTFTADIEHFSGYVVSCGRGDIE